MISEPFFYFLGANINESNGNLDLEESLDDFMTMYAAGMATTSTTLLWCLGEMTRHPEVMEKLVAEVHNKYTISLKNYWQYINETYDKYYNGYCDFLSNLIFQM